MMAGILDRIDPDDLDVDEKLSIIIEALIEAAEERAEILEKLNNLSVPDGYDETEFPARNMN